MSSQSMSDYPVWLGNPGMGQIFPGGRLCGGKMGKRNVSLCDVGFHTLYFEEVTGDLVVTRGHWAK